MVIQVKVPVMKIIGFILQVQLISLIGHELKMPTGSIQVASSSSSDSCPSSSDSDTEHNYEGSPNKKPAALAIRKDGMVIDPAPYSTGSMRDGVGRPTEHVCLAVCERCGNVGVKHAFYSKSKRYCSLACSRASNTPGTPTPPSLAPTKTSSCHVKASYKRPIMVAAAMKKKQGGPHPKKIKHDVCATDLSGTFDWRSCLNRPEFSAAPVSCFKHVALSDCWDSITVGIKLEIENTDCENLTKLFPSFYWIASVIRIEGYYAMLRYEGFETDSTKDFWVNLCSDAVHPVGWCASQGKPLIPPKSIEHKYVDWKDFLVKRLTGARTFPADFHDKLQESLTSKFRPRMRLEVVDKNRISAVRVARVVETRGGRLHVSYDSAGEDDDGFWCHERSLLIHPVGWAQIVGHDLRASQQYARDSLQKSLLKSYSPDDASWELFQPSVIHTSYLFKSWWNLPNHCHGGQSKNGANELRFKEGMKLEAIDPLNLSTICVATVTRVLRNNYLMIGIDGMMAANGSDWFCYHATSPCIFPVGFCDLNNIELTPPRGRSWPHLCCCCGPTVCALGHKGNFKWFDYLNETKSVAAPVSLFKKEIPNHGFKQGMQVEAVDLMEPRLVCVGSISKVVGRLLRLHFDGWDDSYDQWCDCESPDLFPIGWCESVGYKLESPRLPGAPRIPINVTL
ncbi:MBTD1 [Cordylochernes scorpioides]|uniref:MBTD1 n=1 Tax=Cordylochernes scorpioides TaxID=51811 RepID=A0ABY6L5V8_9ARAC|nr:MBTD1 [Cordylochernes scorpioides]